MWGTVFLSSTKNILLIIYIHERTTYSDNNLFAVFYFKQQYLAE